MGQRSTVVFTSGPAGSGKSYRRCAHFLVKEYLPNSEGRHISNFPVRFDNWVDGAGVEQPGLVAIAGEQLGINEATLRERVVVIPQEEIDAWRNEGYIPRVGAEPAGPWRTFEEFDLSGCHLAIDEIHNFCGVHSPPSVRKAWQKWLGELRHRGATIEFLTQHEAKVAKEIANEAEVRLELVAQEQRRDPFFGIQMYYWYNLRSKLTGRWKTSCWIHEYRQAKGKWHEEHAERFTFDATLFGVYDSWSAPIAGGAAGSTGKKEWETKSWPRLLLWFVSCNLPQLWLRFAIACVAVAVVLCRGWIIDYFFSGFELLAPGGVQPGAKAPAPSAAAVAQVKGAAVVVPDVKFEGRPVTPDKVFAIVDRLEFLEDRTNYLEEENTAQADKLAELKERIDSAYVVAGITRDKVIFRSGAAFGVGERIDFGPYNGLKVEGIDYAKRLVVLEGGQSLRMGFGDDPERPTWLQSVASRKAGAVPSPAGVPGGVPGARGDKSAGVRSILAKPSRDNLNGANEPGGVRPSDGGQLPRVDRAGTVVR